jgi:hypothetical protein
MTKIINIDDELDDINDTEESDSDFEEDLIDMPEVDIRLEEANCYKALLRNSLFDEPGPVAKRVEKKVREFIRQELRAVFGMDMPKPELSESQFTPDELARLKALAQRIIEKERGSIEPAVQPAKLEQATPRTLSVNKVQVTEKLVKKHRKVKEEVKKNKGDITIQLPNGKEVITHAHGQTRPAAGTSGYIPPAASVQQIADQQSMAAQESAMNSPNSGLLGLAVHAAQNNLIKSIDQSEE